MDRLTVESCGRILTTACGSGLVRLERASRKLVLREFDQFAKCAGFMNVSEEVLGSLLDDDGLVSESEERVLKGVVHWMQGGGGGMIRGARSDFRSCHPNSSPVWRGGLFQTVLDWKVWFWSRDF
jgi:hypothetical protein